GQRIATATTSAATVPSRRDWPKLKLSTRPAARPRDRGTPTVSPNTTASSWRLPLRASSLAGPTLGRSSIINCRLRSAEHRAAHLRHARVNDSTEREGRAEARQGGLRN